MHFASSLADEDLLGDTFHAEATFLNPFPLPAVARFCYAPLALVRHFTSPFYSISTDGIAWKLTMPSGADRRRRDGVP
jgi:hypothetical protein